MESIKLLPERADSVKWHQFIAIMKEMKDGDIVLGEHQLKLLKLLTTGGYIINCVETLKHGGKQTFIQNFVGTIVTVGVGDVSTRMTNERMPDLIIIDDFVQAESIDVEAATERLIKAFGNIKETFRPLVFTIPSKHKPKFNYKNKFTKPRK